MKRVIPLQIALTTPKLLTPELVDQFRSAVYEYYENNRRVFSWRENISSYRVVVSEVMLQQTQTDRVAQKFDLFIEHFPDFYALAAAPFDQVLRLWKGLGYNRRAQALQKIARCVVDGYGGVLPEDPVVLQTFAGIGAATAASIVTYAFNKPTVFIETNVRTVFIYTFFQPPTGEGGVAHFNDSSQIRDKDIAPLVEQTIDCVQPRQWYYALMDYGVMLKKTVGNVSRLSAHYTKQSRFEGSDRQIRGQILQVLIDLPGIGDQELRVTIGKDSARVERILGDLFREGFVCRRNGGLWLAR